MIGGTQMFKDGAGNYRPFGWLLLVVVTSLFIGLLAAGAFPGAHAIGAP